MRVITEDRLKELLPWPEQDQDVADGLNLATEECKEIDTLTVSKLRPMSEKPVIPEGILQVFVLVYFDYNGIPGVIGFDGRGWQREEKMYGVGWLYLPFYKPADDHREKINLGGCNGSKFEREIEPPINTTRTNCADEMPPDDEVIITECCDAQIPIDQRYCPKCGYECRIHTRKTEGDKCMHSSNCDGLFEYIRQGACSCHISPPCSNCVDAPLVCNKCGEYA